MAKRNKLEIIRDILEIIKENHNLIRPTPLLRKSNLSTARFQEYFKGMLEKRFVVEIIDSKDKRNIKLTDKGFKFLEKYRVIVSFIEEFEL